MTERPQLDFDKLTEANRPLNAFVDFDRAACFGTGPLANVTVGVKSNIAVRGLPWTAGMALHRDRRAASDAQTVAALREAGAAIIGTLNMEEAALGAKTDNPFFGRTHNPHRIGFTPGGSSGGSGAAVSAGLCDLALGTDTMGSVRIPASYCGVYGFKPAQSAVSPDGLELAEPALDVIGPIARSLELLEQAAKLTSTFGNDTIPGKSVTIADLGGVECTSDVLACFQKVCELLDMASPVKLSVAPSRIRYAGFIATAVALHAELAEADEALLSPTLTKLIAYGPRRKDEDLKADREVLAQASEQLNEIVTRTGPIILPTAPQPAFDHAEPAPANQADFTCLANVGNLPAITIPAGTAANGMPIGVQIIGPRGAEAGLFALAHQIDGQLRAYRQPNYFHAV